MRRDQVLLTEGARGGRREKPANHMWGVRIFVRFPQQGGWRGKERSGEESEEEERVGEGGRDDSDPTIWRVSFGSCGGWWEELQLRGAQVQRAAEVACSDAAWAMGKGQRAKEGGPACTASVSASICGHWGHPYTRR